MLHRLTTRSVGPVINIRTARGAGLHDRPTWCPTDLVACACSGRDGGQRL